MEHLRDIDERSIRSFSLRLFGIQTIEDMFPPDNLSGDREPRTPIPPILTSSEDVETNVSHAFCNA
jgi:hypothetical protein